MLLALLATASLGGQACAPLGALAQEALGAMGVVATTPPAANGSSDTILCTITLKGDAALGANLVQVAAKLDQALTGDGWSPQPRG